MCVFASRSGQTEVRWGKGRNLKPGARGLIRYDRINGISQDYYEARRLCNQQSCGI